MSAACHNNQNCGQTFSIAISDRSKLFDIRERTRIALTVRFHTVSQCGSGVVQPLVHPGQNPSFGSFQTPQLVLGPAFDATTSTIFCSHGVQLPFRPGQTEHMLVSLRVVGNAVQFAAS